MTFDEFLVGVRDDARPVEHLMQDAWDAAVAAERKRRAKLVAAESHDCGDIDCHHPGCYAADICRAILAAIREGEA